MKTVIKLFAALSVILMIAGGCGSKPAASGTDDLDVAIREASDYLNNNIPKGSKIVILNIQSSSPDLSDYIIDELLANAVTDKIFSVVDRQQLDAIRAEQNFQWSGEVDDNSAMEIGRFFGAQSIVSGAVSRLGSGYRMRIRALEVQTAQVQGQYNRNLASSPIVTELIGASPAGGTTAVAASVTVPAGDGLTISGLSAYRDRFVCATIARDDPRLYLIAGTNVTNELTITATKISGDFVTLKIWATTGRGWIKYTGNDQNVTLNVTILNKEQLGGGESSTPFTVQRGTVTVNFTNGRGSGVFVATPVPSTPAAPAAPAAQTYRVGDTGPAGGLIFYDKGNNSNGWRYLEAAPVEGESRARWRVSTNTKVDNTSATVGGGKRNTQLIVEVLSKTSGEWDNAAQKADDLVLNGFDDWFLPSKDELDQMYGNLKRRNLGNFKSEWYWSSTIQNDYPHQQNFNDGRFDTGGSTNTLNVRPIRQVVGP